MSAFRLQFTANGAINSPPEARNHDIIVQIMASRHYIFSAGSQEKYLAYTHRALTITGTPVTKPISAARVLYHEVTIKKPPLRGGFCQTYISKVA